MSPTVFLDKDGDAVLVTGGAGGSKIITAAATVIVCPIEGNSLSVVCLPTCAHTWLAQSSQMLAATAESAGAGVIY